MAVFVPIDKTIPADFDGLIKLLTDVQSANCKSLEEQLEHFERAVLNLEFDEHPLAWTTIAYASGAVGSIVDMIPARLWYLENITPRNES